MNYIPEPSKQISNKLTTLKTSTDLQPELIRALATKPNLLKMLDDVLTEVEKNLKANACSIYIIDPQKGSTAKRTATMRAARGYQQYAIDKAKCKILASESVPNNPRKNQKLGLTGWVISTGRSFLAQSPEDIFQHPHWSGEHDSFQKPGAEKLKLSAFLAVPLRSMRGQVIGALKAERTENETIFSVEDQIALEALSRVISRCIAYFDYAQADQVNAAITSWTLDVITEAVATEGELDDFLDIVVRATAAASQADSCSVFLIDESKKTLTQRAGCGSQVLRRGIRSYKLPNPEEDWIRSCKNTPICTPDTCREQSNILREQKVGVTAWVAATGKSFYAKNKDDLRKHCHHLGQFDEKNFEKVKDGQQQCGAWLGVPLVVGGSIIGVLKIENVSVVGKNDKRIFSQDIQQRMDVLAQDIAMSIQRLQIQSPARYQVIQKAMPIILEILRGGLDISNLVNKVVVETQRLFNARACALFLREGKQLIQPQWAAVGWSLQGEKVRRYNLISPAKIIDTPTADKDKVGLTVWIACKKEKFTAKSNLELISHPHHRGTYDRDNFHEGELCESFMGIPLLLGKEKELVGVLKVETKMKRIEENKIRQIETSPEFSYFNEQDELVFDLIANSAAIAIQNARLLESRSLADHVLAQPTSSKVMYELHKFVSGGRVEVVNTLEGTTQLVYGTDHDKAKIIQNFVGLLNPEFYLAILEQLASQMESTLNSLFFFFAAALRVKDLDHLQDQLCGISSKLPIAALTDPNFFLRDCARLFLEISEQVANHIEKYRQNAAQRIALKECLIILRIAKTRVEEMDLFERNLLARIFAHWQYILDIALQQFHAVPNPYVAGRPLDPNSPVFVGREEIFRWIQDNLSSQAQKNVLILHGGWHTGKSSILHQLKAGPLGEHLRARHQCPIFPVFVDLQGIPDPGIDSFLLGVAEYAHTALHERGIFCSDLSESVFRSAPYRAFDSFLKETDQLLMQQNNGLLVIMLDEFEILDNRVIDGKIDKEIFSYLRSKMQHQPSVAFILAGRHTLDEMTSQYRNIVFNVALHKEVGFLSYQEAERLIRTPVEQSAVTYDDGVVERIQRLTGGHPYFIQQLCHTCIDLINQQMKEYRVTHDHLNSALEAALQNNTILSYLWEAEVNENERRVLKSLAHLSKEENNWITVADISIRSDLDEIKTNSSLKKLCTQQLIIGDTQQDPTPHKFRFRIDLLRLWVMRQTL